MRRKIGRTKSYRTSVHKSGRIHIGEAYINELNVDVGDEFSIVVLADGFLLTLIPKEKT